MNNLWATINVDLDALAHNFDVVKQHAPHSKIMSMVKANAYGHGIETIAEALKDKTDAFGVARLYAARILRNIGVSRPIVLMAGVLDENELQIAEELNVDLVVHQYYQVEFLKKLKTDMVVWLKLETGMGRLGFPADNFENVFSEIKNLKHIVDVKVMTHFSEPGNLASDKTEMQIDLFNRVTKNLDAEKSLANSAAIIDFKQSHADWVRPGIMLYGASSVEGKTAAELNLIPVMDFSSKIIAINILQKGDSIGYDSLFVCPNVMKIAVVAIGYGDSYPRHIKADAVVLIDGKRCAIVGRVSMDMITVDVTQLSAVVVGDSVLLWGKGLPVGEIADSADTSSYELLTQIMPRNKSYSKA